MSNSDKPSDSQARSRRLRLVEEPLWLAGSTRTKGGQLVADPRNAELFLTDCPYLPSEFVFHYDEMRQSIVHGSEREPMRDEVISWLIKWFQTQGFKPFSEAHLRHAINNVVRERHYNPLTDWLQLLKWDGHKRLNHWLHWFLGTPDDDYHQMVGSMFLRSMVARAMMPGCKADYMLVLEGPQRTLKSTVCAILGGDWFSDSLPDLAGDPVRLSMHLRGKWLIEVSELSAFSRAEQSRLKQFLSSQIEIFTPKYGRAEVYEPRRCVLMGTTNKSNYLKDETGGSRLWPVKCPKIDTKGLQRVRDQLFAQAYQEVMLEQLTWWPPAEAETRLILPHQTARFEDGGWEHPIAAWDRQLPDHADGMSFRAPADPPFYLAQIADGALGIKPGLLKKGDEMKLAQTLEFMGWTRANRTKHGVPWFPPQVP